MSCHRSIGRRGLLFALALALPLIGHARAGLGSFKIHTLPVGAGNCQVVECPSQNKIVVMDCGSRGRGNRGWDEQNVLDAIAQLGDAETEISISVSHPDEDHYNYLYRIFAQRPVKSIVLSRLPANYNTDMQNWLQRQLFAGATIQAWDGPYSSSAPEPSMSCYKHTQHGWTADVNSYVLAVNAGSTVNDASMVVAMQHGAFKAVFTGDMTGETEKAVNRTQSPVKQDNASWITGAHHGAESHDSNSQSWVDATSPRFVVFSAGTRFGHPRCNAVHRYFVNPRLLQANKQHQFHCGMTNAYPDTLVDSNRDIFVTNDNGWVTVRGLEDGNLEFAYQFDGAADTVKRGSSVDAEVDAQEDDAPSVPQGAKS